MKIKLVFLIVFVLFFSISVFAGQFAELKWHTFMGATDHDTANALCSDGSGNVYVTGYSGATWGSPVNGFSGSGDAFVAALDSTGNRLWNTFLGSPSSDEGCGIALDGSGKVYVAGYSYGTWGSPVNAFNGGNDAFVACLDSSGNLLWHTFIGSSGGDFAFDIVLDSSGKIYLTGYCDVTWGTPLNAHSGNWDIFAACLNSSGNLLWNTFLGSAQMDYGREIALNGSGNVYVIGQSAITWGTPINAHAGTYDAVVAGLDNSGNLLWNTFLGSSNTDDGWGITLDSAGNIYVSGYSAASWSSPVNGYSGSNDAFAARLGSSGNLIWNTFLGSSHSDYGYDVVADGSGNIYVAGYSYFTWGSPVNAFSGAPDAFAAGLDSSGNRLWNTFMGSSDMDHCYGIAVDGSGNVYGAGESGTTWGTPVTAHGGGVDGFLVKLKNYPLADIKANGSDGPLSISESEILQLRVSLNPFGSGENADYWLAYRGPAGWVHYNNSTKQWESGLGVTHQGPLMDFNNKKVFQQSGLTPGNYTFYFGVDLNMNGKVTKSSLYKDEVQVTVTSN